MVFSSPHFLYVFLPLVICLHFLVKGSLRNMLLLFASLLFYAWGETYFVLLMLVSIASNYFLGLLIGKGKRGGFRTSVLVTAVIVNIGLLAFFKYAAFIINNINAVLLLFHLPSFEVPEIHLPIGISFFTFQALSYIIDVYRGKVPVQKNIFRLALFISLFPQLIAGPIIRYHDIARQLIRRVTTLEKFSLGLRRFIIGLAKKVLIANVLALAADKIFAADAASLSAGIAWIGIICFTLQVYFDFSGYSDMAIGIGHMLGFTILENFNYPYISQSVSELWNRWHISLMNWFRDYLYIPLGGSRVSLPRQYFNIITVFFLCGLWHGAEWHFVIWGLFNCVFLILERTGIINVSRLKFALLKVLYADLVFIIGAVFFRSDNLPYALSFIKILFGWTQEASGAFHPYYYIDNATVLAIIVGIIGSAPVYPESRKAVKAFLRKFQGAGGIVLEHTVSYMEKAFLLIIFILCLVKMSAGSYLPFIYFRF